MNIEVTDTEIILAPIKEHPRKGWVEAFSNMHKNNDDVLEAIPDSEELEWEW